MLNDVKTIQDNDKGFNIISPDQRARIEAAIVELIIKERLPISKCESIHLTKLINGE